MTKLKSITTFLLFLCFSLFSSAQSGIEHDQKVIYSNNIYFDFGKSELRPAMVDTLEQLVAFIRDKENISIRVSAHTDAIGSNKNNEILSKNRADAVQQFLVSKGIILELLERSEHGEYLPVAENDTDQGRQLNRRASIEVIQSIPKGPVVTISGVIKDETTDQALQGKVILRSKNIQDSVMTNAKGEYSFVVPDSTILGLDYIVKGYFFKTKMVKAIKGKTKLIETKIKKADCGAKIALKNMYFYGDQAVLLPKSKPEMLRLLKFMQYNPNIKIEVGGHVNEPNKTVEQCSAFGKNLSVKRAQLVYNNMVQGNIDSTRISYKGYANSQMVYPKATREAQMKLNRRVEIKVICDDEHNDTLVE